MVRLFVFCAAAAILFSTGAYAEPDARAALNHFKAYQRQFLRNLSVRRELIRIKDALEIHPLSLHLATLPTARPILVFVAFSRAHPQAPGSSFTDACQEALRLIPTAGFERRLYQLNDLHANQARKLIWQVQEGESHLRIEIVPGSSITITLFSTEDFRQALHETRRAALPQDVLR